MKKYFYTNDLGYRKELIVSDKQENELCFITIWSVDTGDLCHSGYHTKETIINFLKQYGIEASF